MADRYRLTLRHFFDAAHQLKDSADLVTKACANLHGHTYAVEIELSSEKLKSDMIIDFKAIKTEIDILDHQFINEIFFTFGVTDQPTAERIAAFIFERVQRLTDLYRVERVSVCEGYKGENRASWIHFSRE